MNSVKLNPYFEALSDAHRIVCDLCCGEWSFPWYYIFDFWPFNRQWRAYKKLNRIAKYLYQEFQKERYPMLKRYAPRWRRCPMTAHEREFAKRFAERKEKQINSGQCAAQIVDCDCVWCIRQDVEREMRNWKEAPGGE